MRHPNQLFNQNPLLHLDALSVYFSPQCHAQRVSAAQPVKSVAKPIDAKELKTYLDHVAWGRQDEAEAMLKANKELALASGDVTDHAKRTFRT